MPLNPCVAEHVTDTIIHAPLHVDSVYTTACHTSKNINVLHGGTCCSPWWSMLSSVLPWTWPWSGRRLVSHSGRRVVRSSGTRCPGCRRALGSLCSSSSWRVWWGSYSGAGEPGRHAGNTTQTCQQNRLGFLSICIIYLMLCSTTCNYNYLLLFSGELQHA